MVKHFRWRYTTAQSPPLTHHDRLTEEHADALKARNEVGHKVERAHVFAQQREEHGKELLGLAAAQLARRVAEHEELAARHDTSQLGVAWVEQGRVGDCGVRVEDTRDGAGDDGRRARAEGRVRENGGAQEETDPTNSQQKNRLGVMVAPGQVWALACEFGLHNSPVEPDLRVRVHQGEHTIRRSLVLDTIAHEGPPPALGGEDKLGALGIDLARVDGRHELAFDNGQAGEHALRPGSGAVGRHIGRDAGVVLKLARAQKGRLVH